MNIFVGKLSHETKIEDLRKIFGQYGRIVSVKVIMDKITRRPKGFGFVEMEDAWKAKNAIKSLNGSRLYGRTIVVKEARPMSQRFGQRHGRNTFNSFGY
ncbi:MAG: RNA-binding protein [Bacteroidota bacterium]